MKPSRNGALVSLVMLGALLLPRAVLADQRLQVRPSAAQAARVVCLELIDTDARHAAELGIARDGDNFRDTLEAAFSQTSCLVRLRLEGRALTPQRVLATLKQLRQDHTLRASDTLLVYYTGHGAWARAGHVLTMAHGSLYRSDLLQAMNESEARLRILLTDCCSSSGPSAGRGHYRPDADKIRIPSLPLFSDHGDGRTVRDLLLRSEGMIDITAAQPDTPAFGNPEVGGHFTALLTKLLRAPVQEVDSNGDGRVDWNEVVPRLQRDTHGQMAYVFSPEEPAPFVTGPLRLVTGPLP